MFFYSNHPLFIIHNVKWYNDTEVDQEVTTNKTQPDINLTVFYKYRFLVPDKQADWLSCIVLLLITVCA